MLWFVRPALALAIKAGVETAGKAAAVRLAKQIAVQLGTQLVKATYESGTKTVFVHLADGTVVILRYYGGKWHAYYPS